MDPFLKQRSAKLRSENRNSSSSFKYTSSTSTINNLRRKRDTEPALAEALINNGPPKIVKTIVSTIINTQYLHDIYYFFMIIT